MAEKRDFYERCLNAHMKNLSTPTLDFDELGEKGVYLGKVSKSDCKLDFVPVCKRMHLAENVDISGLTTSNEIAEVYATDAGDQRETETFLRPDKKALAGIESIYNS